MTGIGALGAERLGSPEGTATVRVLRVDDRDVLGPTATHLDGYGTTSEISSVGSGG